MRNKVNINEIEQFYIIRQDGMIWSKIKNRWLKPHQNSSGYLHVFITKGVSHPLWMFCHTLVALKYIGEPPTDKHEIDHIDNNRANNDASNLQWVTHSENHLKAYRQGKDHYWLNKHRPNPAIETRMKMASAKNKKVLYKGSGQERVFNSIDEAASQLQTYRKRISLCIKTGKPIQGGTLTLAPDEYYE